MLGDDGRPFKTRSGDTVGLDRAAGRSRAAGSQDRQPRTTTPSPTGQSFRPKSGSEIAEAVGIAALKYADLSQNRTSDYMFSYDKMLAMTGNTATYMQYAYARVRSIFRRGQIDVEALPRLGCRDRARFAGRTGLGLGRCCGSPKRSIVAVADYRPNQLTAYLFDLANDLYRRSSSNARCSRPTAPNCASAGCCCAT